MAILIITAGCGKRQEISEEGTNNFQFEVEKFADLRILRYEVPEFEDLSLQQKELIYYLSQAAIEGRDIIFDQNNKNNLAIRRTLETIYENFNGDKSTEEYKNFLVYQNGYGSPTEFIITIQQTNLNRILVKIILVSCYQESMNQNYQSQKMKLIQI